MTKEKKIVEVTVTNDGGEQVPVGIMTAKQALSLPEEMDVSVSHPDPKVGATDEFIDRDGAGRGQITDGSANPCRFNAVVQMPALDGAFRKSMYATQCRGVLLSGESTVDGQRGSDDKAGGRTAEPENRRRDLFGAA
jgi:hypothetical protein